MWIFALSQMILFLLPPASKEQVDERTISSCNETRKGPLVVGSDSSSKEQHQHQEQHHNDNDNQKQQERQEKQKEQEA